MEFHQLFPWARIPVKATAAKQKLVPPDGDFRHEGRCAPFVRGRSLGYQLPSPIECQFKPLNEQQFCSSPETAAAELERRGLVEGWVRDGGVIGLAEPFDLKKFKLESDGPGSKSGMFLPNGRGTIEWKLGFSVTLPQGSGLLLIADNPPPGLVVPTALLTQQNLDQMTQTGGFAIAVRPVHNVLIERGTLIARMIEIPLKA